MRKFIIKRLFISVFILLCATFVIYALMRCLPASYVENMAMQLAAAPGAKPYNTLVYIKGTAEISRKNWPSDHQPYCCDSRSVR